MRTSVENQMGDSGRHLLHLEIAPNLLREGGGSGSDCPLQLLSRIPLVRWLGSGAWSLGVGACGQGFGVWGVGCKVWGVGGVGWNVGGVRFGVWGTKSGEALDAQGLWEPETTVQNNWLSR